MTNDDKPMDATPATIPNLMIAPPDAGSQLKTFLGDDVAAGFRGMAEMLRSGEAAPGPAQLDDQAAGDDHGQA